MKKAIQFKLTDNKYEVTFDDGTVQTVGSVISKGTLRKDEPLYDHVLKFSDGVTQLFVGSQEVVQIPDLSFL